MLEGSCECEKYTCISVGAGVCVGCCVCMCEAVVSQELCWCGFYLDFILILHVFLCGVCS